MLITFQNVVFAFFRDRRFLTVHYFFENENEDLTRDFFFISIGFLNTIRVKKELQSRSGAHESAELPEEENPLAGLSEEDLKQLQAALQAEAAAGSTTPASG